MEGRHLKHLVLFLVVLTISFFRVERDKEYLQEDFGKAKVLVLVEGLPSVEAGRLKVRVKIIGGDLPEIYDKTGYLTLFGAEDLPSKTFEVLGRVRLAYGKVFINASYKDIKKLVFTRESIRELLMRRVDERIQDQEIKALVFSYLFGESQEILPFEYQTAFWQTGLLHILVVSGFHLSLVALILRFLLPGRYGFILSLIGISFYSFFVVPLDPPVLRAYIMIFFAFLILLIYRRPDYLSLLFLSGSIILLIFPEYLSSYSFWLSFVATLYLILANVNVDGIKKSFPSRHHYYIFMSFWGSLFATLSTSNIVATFSYITPLGIVFTPLVSMIFIPFTAYGILGLFTFFSLPTFPLELFGKIILNLVSIISHISFTLNASLSVETAIFLNITGGVLLYFLKDWWKVLVVFLNVPFLLPLWL